MCFTVVHFVLQMYNLFFSCAMFVAVELLFCMIPTYNFAVVPFFELYNLFCSCTFIFLVVLVLHCS